MGMGGLCSAQTLLQTSEWERVIFEILREHLHMDGPLFIGFTAFLLSFICFRFSAVYVTTNTLYVQ